MDPAPHRLLRGSRCLTVATAAVGLGFGASACGGRALRTVHGVRPPAPAVAPQPYADRTDACADAVADAALAAVNAARLEAGIAPVSCLAPLVAMAGNHARYLAANADDAVARPHGETGGQPAFTGVDLPARAAAAGLDAGAFWLVENVGGRGGAAAVVAAHLGSVYHRSPLLAPGGRFLAYAVARDGPPVLESLARAAGRGDTAAAPPALFPGPDATGVPTAFEPTRETPDPLPGRPRVGYPISVHFPRVFAVAGGREALLAVGRFALFDEGAGESPDPGSSGFAIGAEAADGAPIATLLLTPEIDVRLAGSDAFLVPEAPLTSGHIYRVELAAHYGDATLQGHWRFATAAAAAPPPRVFGAWWRGGDRSTIPPARNPAPATGPGSLSPENSLY